MTGRSLRKFKAMIPYLKAAALVIWFQGAFEIVESKSKKQWQHLYTCIFLDLRTPLWLVCNQSCLHIFSMILMVSMVSAAQVTKKTKAQSHGGFGKLIVFFPVVRNLDFSEWHVKPEIRHVFQLCLCRWRWDLVSWTAMFRSKKNEGCSVAVQMKLEVIRVSRDMTCQLTCNSAAQGRQINRLGVKKATFFKVWSSAMEITLNLRTGSLKPEAIENRLDELDRLDDLLPDENSPRALYGTDSPVANRKPQISPKAKRPRRTAAVLFEDRIGGRHLVQEADHKVFIV